MKVILSKQHFWAVYCSYAFHVHIVPFQEFCISCGHYATPRLHNKKQHWSTSTFSQERFTKRL